MKKIISVVLILVLSVAMTVAFGGCKSGGTSGTSGTSSSGASAAASGDAYEVYTAANTALQAAAGFSADTDITMGMTVAGQKMDIALTGDILYSKVSDSEIQMQMNQSMDLSGAAIQMESYYKDGYMYTSVMGMKQKMQTPLEQAMTTGQTPNFKKEDIKDSSITESGGNKVLNFTIAGEGLKDVVMQSMPSSLVSTASAADFTFTDAKITATVDADGNMISSEVSMTFTMTVSGQAMDASMDMKTNNIKIGAQTITFPADLDTYTETPAS